MPFKSLNQEKAAFAGGLGSKMKKAAPQWAAETNQKSLPVYANKSGGKKKVAPTDPMAILAAPRGK